MQDTTQAAHQATRGELARRDDLDLQVKLGSAPTASTRLTNDTKPIQPSSPSPNRPYHLTVVLNPAGGSQRSYELWKEAEDVLQKVDVKRLTWEVVETKGKEDAERIGRELAVKVRQDQGETKQALMILGGDGTVHEVLNGLLVREGGEVAKVPMELIVIPAGTANALYYSLFPPSSPLYPTSAPGAVFYSLLSFLGSLSPSTRATEPHAQPKSSLLPLSLALNSLPTGDQVLTTVVTSAALHAAILHDAESLRTSHPGIERFKLAAQQNAAQWVSGALKLRGEVRRYDSTSKQWLTLEGDIDGVVQVEGEFAYMTTALVDRFEPSFVVAPFRSPLHPLSPLSSSDQSRDTLALTPDPSIDLILIRPLRHAPTALLVRQGRSQEAKDKFVDRVWEVSGGMYQEGRHVDLVYGQEERIEGEEEGGEVVEVFRCGKFEWVPPLTSPFRHLSTVQTSAPSTELKDRLVCLDGALHDLGPGGNLKTKALGAEDVGVRVWA
ncbi:hypothetical protein JCM11641_006558 [Rhodosporidiobolus odoratus]